MMLLALVVGLALLPLLAVGGLVGFRSPLKLVLPVYAVLVPFGSGITLPIPLPSPFNTVTTLVGLIAAGCLVAHRMLCTSAPPRLLPEVVAWILFAGVNGLTYLWSIDAGKTLSGFSILLSLLGLYVLLTLMPVTWQEVHLLGFGSVVGGLAICLWGLYLLATDNLPEEKAGLPRFSIAGGVGDAADPNITAAVLVFPLAVAAGYALFGTRSWLRLAAALSAATMAGGILLTASRGGMLAAGVGLLVLIAHHRRRLPVLVAAGVVGLLVLVGSMLAAPEQVSRLDQAGSSGRTNIWRTALAACPRYCAYGSGLNTFPDVQEETLLSTPEIPGFRLGEPAHNIWLGAAVETGIVSIVLLGAGLGLSAASLWRLPGPVRAVPLAGLAGLLTSNMFLGNLRFKYFWLVLMYAAAWPPGWACCSSGTAPGLPP
jgi:O-antigen ligase